MSGVYALMDTLLPFEWLHYTFMKNALIAIVLLTPLFGMLGTMAVDNKMAFFSDALGHSALTGIAIGVMLGWQSQMSAMLLFGLIWAVLITFVKHHSKMSADTIISVFSSTSIALGLVVHHLLPKVVKAVEPFLPAFSMVCILAIICAVVAGSASHIASVGFVVIIAVILHNTIGLLGGYWGGRLFGFDESTCRTLAIEVGMQNSGLAAALGKIYFGPLAALPGALFSVWHNLSGSLLAGYWSGKPIVDKSRKTVKES